MKAAIIVILFIVTIGGFFLANYIHYKNYAVEAEAGIEATHTNNKTLLSTYTTKVIEATSVTDIARDDLTKVMESALSARYGEGGSKAVFNWIQENYPGKVDPKLYQKVQQIIESGRNDFQTGQTTLLDKLRIYEQNREYVWSGFWISLAGYPKKDLSKFNVIVTDDVTEKFNIGKDAPVVLRPIGK